MPIIGTWRDKEPLPGLERLIELPREPRHLPYRRVHDYEWLAPSFYDGMQDTMFLDLAIYGMKQRGDNDHRRIEKKLEELGGIKTLISHNYYEEAEFWSIFNKPNYDAVKAITDPNNIFRDLYTKMCRAAIPKCCSKVSACRIRTLWRTRCGGAPMVGSMALRAAR